MEQGKGENETVHCPKGQFLVIRLNNGNVLKGYINKTIRSNEDAGYKRIIVINTYDGNIFVPESDIVDVHRVKDPEQYTKLQQGLEFYKAAKRCLIMIEEDPLVIAYMVNSAFACEVFIKGILDEHSVNYGKTHRLNELFDMLPAEIKNEFITIVGMDDFAILLRDCGSAFEEFRYLHENIFVASKYNLKFWEAFVETTKTYAEKNIFQGAGYDLPDRF